MGGMCGVYSVLRVCGWGAPECGDVCRGSFVGMRAVREGCVLIVEWRVS